MNRLIFSLLMKSVLLQQLRLTDLLGKQQLMLYANKSNGQSRSLSGNLDILRAINSELMTA
jgi:hypothetical protein